MTVKRIGRRLQVLLVMLAPIAGAAFWAFLNVGRWLLAPCTTTRAGDCGSEGPNILSIHEGADIYRQGWAPEVWLFQDEPEDADAAFASFGIHYSSEHDYNQQGLEQPGVPKAAIRVLEPPTTNTVG